MQSNFDPTSFLEQSIQGQLSTRYVLIPQGEYPAIISKYEARQHEKEGKVSTIVDVTFEIDDANAREITGLPNPTVRQSVFLDLTAEGKLDTSKGKNVPLGRMLKALGLTDDDGNLKEEFRWNSLLGQPCFVAVEHNPSKDGKETYANVGKIGKTRS